MILWDQGQRAEALEQMQIARDLKARIGISTEDEDQALIVWRLMERLGLDTMDELNALLEKVQAEQEKQASSDEESSSES